MAPPKVITPKEPAPAITREPATKGDENVALFKVEGVGDVRAAKTSNTSISISIPAIAGGERDIIYLNRNNEGESWRIRRIDLDDEWSAVVQSGTIRTVFNKRDGTECGFGNAGELISMTLNEKGEPVSYEGFTWRNGSIESMDRITGYEYMRKGEKISGIRRKSDSLSLERVTQGDILQTIETIYLSMDTTRDLAKETYDNAVKAVSEMRKQNILGINDGKRMKAPPIVKGSEGKTEIGDAGDFGQFEVEKSIGTITLRKIGEGSQPTATFTHSKNEWLMEKAGLGDGWTAFFENEQLAGLSNSKNIGCRLNRKGDVESFTITKDGNEEEYSGFQHDNKGKLVIAQVKVNGGSDSVVYLPEQLNEIAGYLVQLKKAIKQTERVAGDMEIVFLDLRLDKTPGPPEPAAKSGWRVVPKPEQQAGPAREKKLPPIRGETKKRVLSIPFPTDAVNGLNERFFGGEFTGNKGVQSTAEHCKVLWTQDALQDLNKFAELAESVKDENGQFVEVMGLIRGELYKDVNGEDYFMVKGIVMPENFESNLVNVKFGEEGLAQLMAQFDALQKSGVDDILGGWIHSHPGHGVFFSSTDIKTHMRMFKQDYQFGVVLDPIKEDVGTLTVKDGNAYYMNGRVFAEPGEAMRAQDEWEVVHPV